MEFLQFTIKIPVPSRRWFRFSIKTLLFLMLFVALACIGWRVYRGSQHARLIQQVEETKAARDNALQGWKQARSALRSDGQGAVHREAAFRSEYFRQRSAVETALQRVARFEGRPENHSSSAHQ